MPPSRRRTDIEIHLRQMFPKAPPKDIAAIADRAEDSRGLYAAKAPNAAWLSAVAFIRHVYTDYDALLEEGYGVEAARHFTLDSINGKLLEWGSRRLLDASAAHDE